MKHMMPLLVVLTLVLVNRTHQVRESAAEDVSPIPDANVLAEPPVEQPSIIWFHSVSSSDPESLRVALSSGIVSHVMLLYMHRNDASIEDDKVKAAVKMIRDYGAKLIWCRDLWPYYANKSCDADQIYDGNYYVHEIFHLRQEVESLKADAMAFDCEPYGDSVFKPVFKDADARALVDLARMNDAVQDAVSKIGQVDYVLPAGSTTAAHPLNVTRTLGKIRISESTYYNSPTRLQRVKYPYEIFGAYLRRTADNPADSRLPFYTPEALFDYSEVWSEKQGVLLYTDGPHSLDAAKSLFEYTEKIRMQFETPLP